MYGLKRSKLPYVWQGIWVLILTAKVKSFRGLSMTHIQDPRTILISRDTDYDRLSQHQQRDKVWATSYLNTMRVLCVMPLRAVFEKYHPCHHLCAQSLCQIYLTLADRQLLQIAAISDTNLSNINSPTHSQTVVTWIVINNINHWFLCSRFHNIQTGIRNCSIANRSNDNIHLSFPSTLNKHDAVMILKLVVFH